MKKTLLAALLLLLAFGSISLISLQAQTIVPYRTYTEDSKGQLILTQDAYIPIFTFSHVDFDSICELQWFQNKLYVLNQKPGRSSIFVFDERFNYVTRIPLGIDVLVPEGFYLTEDRLYIADNGLGDDGAIHVFTYNSLTHAIQSELTIGKPDTPLFGERTPFLPAKVAADARGNIYVVSEGAINGILQLSANGRFFGFFGANLSDTSRIRSLWSNLFPSRSQISLPPTPSNLAVDTEGFIYTVTAGLESSGLKKFNVASRNFLPSDLNVAKGNIDVAIGNYGNILTISNQGIIREYDIAGNMLFSFGGSLIGDNRMGLFQEPSAIAVTEDNRILVADRLTNVVTVFEQTEFAHTVHLALEKYQMSEFDTGIDLWNEVLFYNTWFDLAYEGIGNAFMSQGDYKAAMEAYRKTNNIAEYSNAFWELRNQSIDQSVGLFVILFFVLQLFFVWKKAYNKAGHTLLPAAWHAKMAVVRSSNGYRTWTHPLRILRHPLDTFFEIKHKIHASWLVSTAIYVSIAVVYFVRLYGSSYIFIGEIETSNVFMELFILYAGVFLFIGMNYLVCTIREGSGFFREVYSGVAYSLLPLLATTLGMTLISRVLTLNEAFLYNYIHQIATVWTVILLFFMVKDIHQYEVGETIVNLILTLFTMLVFLFVAFMIYVIFSQSLGFFEEIIKEAMLRASNR
jgi:tetratricopeptide (TPR) repeat protein